MATGKRTKAPVDRPELLSKARASLDVDGVVKIASLGPKAMRAEMVRVLGASGFEATKSVVRRPVVAQLVEAFAEGAYVPLKSVASVVRGATAAEVKRVAMRLVHDGRLRLVVRGNAEVLVPASAAVLSGEETTTLRKALDSVTKNLTKACKHRGKASVLRSDVLEAMENVVRELNRRGSSGREHPAESTNGAKQSGSTMERVLAALDATTDDRMGMSFVPQIVARLRPQIDAKVVREALSDAAAGGLIELRPEGGLGRLTQEELDACLEGPQGTRLSWARRVDIRGS